MHRYGRFLLTIVVCLGAVITAVPAWLAAANQPDPLYNGTAQISGALQLDMVISPTSVGPGDPLSLTVTLTNLSQVTHAPTIHFQLPPALSLQGTRLPAGATFNLMNNRLSWQPIVAANGGMLSFNVSLVAETAVIQQPDQTVTAEMSYDNLSFSASATVWVGISPQINSILLPAQAAIGQPVHLRSEISGSGPIGQNWSLGDGRQVQVIDPVVVFPAAGVYQVGLMANNPAGSDTASRTITIVPHPAAQFALPDATVALSHTLRFVNQSGGLPPLSYRWEFGDGATSDVANPEHIYQNPGIYQVKLTVSNQFGESQAYLDVTVGAPPAAAMDLPVAGQVGAPVAGQAFGDGSVSLFRWETGDGRTYESAYLSHTYTRSGDYYVRLIAENEYGQTEVGQWLRIDPGTLSLYLPIILTGQEDGMVTAVTVDRPGVEINPALPAVALDTPFVMQPIELPPGLSPAEQLFAYINEARAQFGLNALNLVPAMSQAAQAHTTDMARFGYTAHVGFDGSVPAERLLATGYSAGYAGEATAWGFEYPYQAVEFWVNSPSHRRIILNQFATDVGVGYTVDLTAPNVWYWTAEFGNAFASPNPAQIRLQDPLSGLEAFVTDVLNYSWNWPLPLQPDQQFVVYITDGREVTRLGAVSQPALNSRYTLQTAVSPFIDRLGNYEWQVRLESGGSPQAESERRSLIFGWDPAVPTPTPIITPTPTQTPSPTPSPTPQVTATAPPPQSTPVPPPPTMPPLVTVTPAP